MGKKESSVNRNREYVGIAAGVAVALAVGSLFFMLVGGKAEESGPAPSATASAAPTPEVSASSDDNSLTYPVRVLTSWNSDKADRAEARRISLDGVSFPVPEPGTTYAFVTLQVQNKSKFPANIGFDAVAEDASGANYQMFTDYNSYNSKTLNPGTSVKHSFMFQVPVGARLSLVNFRVGMSMNDSVEVTAKI